MSGRVLVIEPDPELGELVMNTLEDLGYEVFIAHSELMAFSFFGLIKLACVVIDLDQGHAEWAETGLRLAKQASSAGLQVVMIRNYAHTAATLTEQRWAELRKPFTLEGIQEVLRQVLPDAGEPSPSA